MTYGRKCDNITVKQDRGTLSIFQLLGYSFIYTLTCVIYSIHSVREG